MRMGGKKMLISKKFFYCPAFSGGCPASSGGSSPRFYGQGCRFFCRRRGTFVTPVRVSAGESERSGCALRAVCVDWGRRCSKRRCSGRHKCRPYGASVALRRLNVVSRRLFCGVARRGAIHDARCRNGTIDQSRCASAAGGGLRVEVGRACGLGAAVFQATQVSPLRCVCCIAAAGRGQKNGNRLARSGSRCVG